MYDLPGRNPLAVPARGEAIALLLAGCARTADLSCDIIDLWLNLAWVSIKSSWLQPIPNLSCEVLLETCDTMMVQQATYKRPLYNLTILLGPTQVICV